ncbi:YcxB family protein [Calothrix sp. PCC 7507]|uniref:YcxB family protein n=1 Tax=Calothrix sp. PCC 7507 TaxID=99598 RepID=UPI00029ED879|nr:YcxB family protein [Calothrix sp. PCC 7507]AFY32762.1 hypothetical protein Cal7507_2330 [Calothrix sp. PCC 7507]
MQFAYRLNVNDLKEASQSHSKKGLLKYCLLMAGILLLTSILPLLTQGGISFREIFWSILLPNILFFIFIYVLMRILQNFLISRNWKSQPGAKSDISVETTEEGLQITTQSSDSRLKWSLYTHWKETPNLFMVYQSHNCFNIFPKRAFSSEEQVNEFRALLRTNLQNK